MEENTEIEFCEICNRELELDDGEIVHMYCILKLIEED